MCVVNIKNSRFDVYGGRKNGAHMLNTRVGEAGWLGNPHVMKGEEEREKVCALFKRDFWKKLNEDAAFLSAVLELEGKVLGCYCKPAACHLDVVARFLEWVKTEDGKQWLKKD